MKHKKFRTYLSGGMEFARKEGANWRSEMELWVKENLNHSAFNPNTESQKFLAKKFPKGDFRKLKFDNVEKFTTIVKDIVDLDSREIARHSDYVICYWDASAQKGAGTKGELTIAKFFRKPVYMVTRMQHHNIPGWILGCTTKFFSSFQDLQAFLLAEYSH